VALVIAVVVLGAVMAGAYYHDEISVNVHLQGWDRASPEKLVRDFVRQAHDGDPGAANALDGQRAKPVTKGGKLTGIAHEGERGSAQASIAQFVPTPDVKQVRTRIRPISRVFGVAVEYTDGHWVEFAVDRTPAGLKIVNVSDVVGDHQLPERD